MKGRRIGGLKLILVGLSLLLTFTAIWFVLSRELYYTIQKLQSGAEIVEINVYALCIPIGFLGILIWTFSGFFTVVYTQKQVNSVWSLRTQKIFNRVIGYLGIAGIVFAIITYQWLTYELEANGYTYSEKQSRLSAMGKHEVYIKP